MGKVFTGLLQENALSLEKISNLDAKPVNIEGQLEETNLLYEHGLSLELKGQYMNALKYLQSLESQDWQLYWDELKFSSNTYPNGTLAIKVHTLSTSDSLLDL
jgi:MSHA biogenesis protein MshJ